MSAIDRFDGSKFAWVVLLKEKNCVTVTNASQKVLNKAGFKPNKIWVDKGRELQKRSMKSWLQVKVEEVYSIHDEWKSVVAERPKGALKKIIYKYRALISKNVHIVKLTNRIKPILVKCSTFIDFGIENNEKDPKFKFSHHVITSKYKNIFQMVTVQIGLKRFLWLKKFQMLFLIDIQQKTLMVKKLLECLWKRIAKKQIKQSSG